MSTKHEPTVGYSQLDEKGRLSLAKTVRQALGLRAGSTVAYVKVGDALMLVPQDAYLAHMMEDVIRVLENAGIQVDDVVNSLPQARAESVNAHYGDGFLETLDSAGAAHDASQAIE